MLKLILRDGHAAATRDVVVTFRPAFVIDMHKHTNVGTRANARCINEFGNRIFIIMLLLAAGQQGLLTME